MKTTSIFCSNEQVELKILSKLLQSDMRGNLNCKTGIVVDAICNGERTFTDLAKTLKAKKHREMVLIVLHSIFNNNIPERLQEAGYHHVYSTNSIIDRTEKEFYKQHNIFEQ